MKDNFNYNISPTLIAVVSTFLTLFNAICSNFGNLDLPTGFGRGELSGTVLIIIFLVLPAFFKGYRKYIWTKKGLIILFIALIINFPIGIYCTVNRFNIYGEIL